MHPETPAGPVAASSVWPELRWPLLICGYFAFQVIWRRLLGAGLNLDEAEILLWSRHLAMGYGPQPPLYSWLQWGFLQAIPDPLLALSLLKNIALAATYLGVWRLLRSAYPARIAGPATLALFLVPQIAWDSQRDLTHSVLATALAAGTALAFWTRALPGRRGGWALVGLLTGAGMLAKPNFLVVPAAFVLAALTLADLRGRVRPAGVLLAVAIAAAIVALPLRWALAHPELAFASAHKLAMAGAGGRAALAGLGALGKALVDLLALPLVVAGAILWLNRDRRVAAPWTPLERLILRAVLIGLALAVVGVLASGTTNIRRLWLLPVVYLTAPLVALRLMAAVGAGAVRGLVRTVAVLAVVVVVALGVNIRYGEPGNPSLTRAPVADVIDEVLARHPDAGLIVAAPSWLAGDLAYLRPGLPVVGLDDPGAAPPPGTRVVALWWDGDWRERIAAALARSWGAPVTLGPAERLSRAFPLQPGEPFDVDVAEVGR